MAVEQNNKPHTADDANLFSWIQINTKYFRSLPGVMKILELVVGVICLFLSSPAFTVTSQWFAYIVIICIVVTAIWCFIYLLSAREAVSFPINWALTEMLNTFFLAIIIGITSVFQISHWAGAHNIPGRWMNISAGIFGSANCVFYLISTCLAYVDWQQTHTINP